MSDYEYDITPEYDTVSVEASIPWIEATEEALTEAKESQEDPETMLDALERALTMLTEARDIIEETLFGDPE